MPATFATFKRLKDKGIAALRQGDRGVVHTTAELAASAVGGTLQ